MRRARVLVKLGGSVLTNKSTTGPPRFLASRARSLCRQLVAAHVDTDLVVILGAGSWGHPQALRHGVGTRRLRGAARAAASREISASVADFRRRFCEVALRAGLPVVPLSAATMFGVRRPNLDPLRWIVEGGLVPVTGGDVIPDARRGLRILSGDEIGTRLLPVVRPRLVVFATDVEGVRVGPRVAASLSLRRVKALLPEIDPGTDATGGMRGKLEQALQALGQGVPVRILDGRSPTALAQGLAGRPVGTLLRP